MSNIRNINGSVLRGKRIGDLRKGEQGYTVPWAWSQEKGIDEDFRIYNAPGGTVALLVKCIEPGLYDLSFTKPWEY